jgi:molecular chaperone GrpE
MSENNKEETIIKQENPKNNNEGEFKESDINKKKDKVNELTVEEKLSISEDKLLRSLAEIENQRRRFEKEIKDAFEFGFFNFAKESLAILDNLQRAKEAIKNDEKLKENKDLDKFLENISIIEKDLISIFEKNNIKKIDTDNNKFDPNIHQAMSEIEDEKTEVGTVLQEIQAGYMLGDRLLRPSLVSVSKKKTSKDHENIDKKEEK